MIRDLCNVRSTMQVGAFSVTGVAANENRNIVPSKATAVFEISMGEMKTTTPRPDHYVPAKDAEITEAIQPIGRKINQLRVAK